MKKTFAVLLLLTFLIAVPSAYASVPYETLTIGMDGTLVETQTAYEPVRSMTKFGSLTLKKPSDIFLGPDENLYIADTGNKRILVITKKGDYVKTIGDKKTFSSPTGVFVDAALNTYVADEEKKCVFLFDKEGNLTRTYGRPDHPMFGASMAYAPSKVAVDERGRLYIVSTGNYNGIIHLTKDGEFLGYFGSNTSKVNFLTTIKEMLYSSERFAKDMSTIIPISIANLTIDEQGMIYVVTASTGTDSIKRLNVAGRNNLTPTYTIEQPLCIALTPSGSVIVANSKGEIMELSNEGDMLFLSSAVMRSDIRMGLFKSVSGMTVDKNSNIYVLDKSLCSVQVLAPTEFAGIVHDAFTLFGSGKYTESKELWTQAKRMNSLFSYASTGLGETLYREENYQEAMKAFRNAGEKQGYSDAYWEVRANWLQKHLGTIVLILAVLLVLILAAKIIQKKTGFFEPAFSLARRFGSMRLIYQLSGATYMLKNPSDACYCIKRTKRGGYLSATIILVLFFAVYVTQKYYSGFLFKTVRDGTFEIIIDAEVVFLLFFLAVCCSYLVSTIKDGEARFKDLYVGYAYSLTPMILFIPVAVLLSNVVTNNEAFLVTMLQTVSIAWSVLLFVLSLMFLNDYSFKKTISVIIWTLFTALVVLAVFFIVLVLTNQLTDFVLAIYGEVVYRFV